MDYKSPFELKRQFLEEAKAAQSPKRSAAKSAKQNGDSGSGSVLTSSSSVNSAANGNLNLNAIPDDPTALVREVPGAENLKALNASRERDEAVQRYMENENLTLEECARYIMENGSTAQRISFFAHVKDNLAGVSNKRIGVVLDILLDSMWAQDPDLQCRAPEDIIQFLGLLNNATAKSLYEVTKTMLTVKTLSVRKAWGAVILALLGYVSSELLIVDIIPLAVKKSEHAETQDQRELSCAIFGSICQYLPREKAEALVLPRALALCQDTNVGVRQCMCQQLGSIARCLGVQHAKEKIAPDLFELLNDEERVVSRSAFSCLLDLVEFFGSDYRKEKLYPIIKNFISNPPSEVISLLIVEFGRFLDEIKEDIATDEDAELFANFYYTASLRSDEDSKKHCSFNLPAVAASLPLKKFPIYIEPALRNFSVDSCQSVRKPVASGMHELIPILGSTAYKFLEIPVLSLIGDEDREVRNLLFKHLPLVLDNFCENMPKSQLNDFFEKVGKALLKLVPEGKTFWHSMQHFLFYVNKYQEHFSEALIVEKFIPSILDYLKVGANNLKDECSVLFASLLVRVNTPNSCVQILSRVTNEFAHSSSCYERVSYLRITRELSKQFSRRFVRERLLESCLELQRDRVKVVRLNLARTLPFLCKGLRTQTPGAFEEEFNNMLVRLSEDEDDEVVSAAKSSKLLIEKLEGEKTREAKNSAKDEAEDLKREKREQQMLDMAKEADKAERRSKLKNLLKTEKEKEVSDSAPTVRRQKSANKTKNSSKTNKVDNYTLPRIVTPQSSQKSNASTASHSSSTPPPTYVRRRL